MRPREYDDGDSELDLEEISIRMGKRNATLTAKMPTIPNSSKMPMTGVIASLEPHALAFLQSRYFDGDPASHTGKELVFEKFEEASKRIEELKNSLENSKIVVDKDEQID